MANRNRQRDAWVGVVQIACTLTKSSLPEELVVVFAEGSQVYQVISLSFSAVPDQLVKRLYARAYSIDEAILVAAFMSRCDFVIRDEPHTLGELKVRRCSIVEPMTLDDQKVGGRHFEMTYIPD